MKKHLVLCAALFLGTLARADTAPFELTGLLVVGPERRFSLVTEQGKTSPWIQVGEEFAGWKLLRYDEKDAALVVGQNGRETRIFLNRAQVQTATVKATVEDAQNLFEKMRLQEMLTKMFDQQKLSMAKVMRQMTAQMKVPPEQADAVAAFQAKVAEVVMAELKADEIQGDLAKIYADAFTKQQLQDIAAFYSTATGQAMVDKQPEMQAKMQELIMPRMMRAMPKIQQMAQQFQAEMAAKAAPAPAAAAPVPPKN